MTSTTKLTRFQVLAGTLCALLLCSACGEQGKVEQIPADAVPFDLLATARPTQPLSNMPPTSPPQGSVTARVFFFDEQDDKLTSRAANINPSDTKTELDQLMSILAAGPTSDQSQRELRTLVPTDTTFSVNSVEKQLASITFELKVDPPNDLLHLFIGQIVLTVCSLPEVEEVKLAPAGSESFSVPLPDSTRVTRALRRSDYKVLLDVPPSNDEFMTSSASPTTKTLSRLRRPRRHRHDEPT